MEEDSEAVQEADLWIASFLAMIGLLIAWNVEVLQQIVRFTFIFYIL